MGVDYLRYMRVIYSNTITKAKRWFYLEEKMFINCMKSFILKIGISSKKLYEKIFQSLLNSLNKEKESICSFDNFLKSFSFVLKFKEENTVLKYKTPGDLTASLTLFCVWENWLQNIQQIIISKMITEENVS